MSKSINYTSADLKKGLDEYDVFIENLKNHFGQSVAGGKKLFKTNATGLNQLYLSNIIENKRQEFTCDACNDFLERFGGLVIIDENGKVKSALWDVSYAPPMFVEGVAAMQQAVMNSEVIGVFSSNELKLGKACTGLFSHMSVDMESYNLAGNAEQVMAKKLQDFEMLNRAVEEYSLSAVQQAIAIIQSESLFRGEKVVDRANWFKDTIVKINKANSSKQKKNLIWLSVATAPEGFCHIRGKMLGELLEDIQAGLEVSNVVKRFNTKMDDYMRSQTSPTENAIYEAEKIIEKQGLKDSLPRRYAWFDEIPSFLWKNRANAKTASMNKAGGVFSHITPKKKVAPSGMELPSAVMTWEKFKRTVLPTADNIEVLVDDMRRLMALVTAQNKKAPNMLLWDNLFSWYYHGGMDANLIKKRVENAGGRYENNEIRASLIWGSYTDLDLHVMTPIGEHISFAKLEDSLGGKLDIDMNANGVMSSEPVENVRWVNNAPEGRYVIFVHNYTERGTGNTPFKVELEVLGRKYAFESSLIQKGKVIAFEFDYVKGQQPKFIRTNHTCENDWAIPVDANNFVKVNGITTSPNLWGVKKVPHAGTHIFFLLDGVKDLSNGKGRGFFNETLKSELHSIRKTLESYTANTPILGADEASACGVGYSKEFDWNLTVRVTSNNTTRIINIDRWD